MRSKIATLWLIGSLGSCYRKIVGEHACPECVYLVVELLDAPSSSKE